MLKRNQIISSLSPLAPTSIINTNTGEYISLAVLQDKVALLVTAVQEETVRLYKEQKTTLFKVLTDYTGTPAPAEFARQKGFRTSFNETLPPKTKAKSRLEKLVQYKLIAEVSSYVKNPTPGKREPSFGRTVNLGAVDKQMASVGL